MYLFPQLFYKAVLFIHINTVSYIYQTIFFKLYFANAIFFKGFEHKDGCKQSVYKIFHSGPELSHHFGLNPLGTQSLHFSKEGGGFSCLTQPPVYAPGYKACPLYTKWHK